MQANMRRTNPLVAPVLKWVGGKRQLLHEIKTRIPKYNTYFEPFCGGAAVLFALQPSKAIISDTNSELINVYKVIKDNADELIKILEEHKKKNSEEYFYTIRSLDRLPEAYAKLTDTERAARIIYLNKTCYNGLFRVNSAGEFNSPWGRYKNPNIISETTIKALHIYFTENKITFLDDDYKKALNTAKKGDFVYLDPPYLPLSDTSNFTGYTAGGFSVADQEKLKQVCDNLNKKGVNFLLSNSSCDFIKNIYASYYIDEVEAKRSINSIAEKRGEIKEVLIRNYEYS